MAGVLYLGNQMVSPVIVQGEEKAFNVDGYDWLGEINVQGELVAPTRAFNPVFNGVQKICTPVLNNKFRDRNIKTASFPDLETIEQTSTGPEMLFQYTFYYSQLENIYFPKLKTITGPSSEYQMFDQAFSGSKLVALSFPELETITGIGTFGHVCLNNNDLKTVSFPKLKNIPRKGFYEFCAFNAPNLESVDFRSVETIETLGFKNAFTNRLSGGGTKISSINFDSLKSIGRMGLDWTFGGSLLESVSFPSLTYIDSCGLEATFQDCKYLEHIYFPSLTTSSFGDTDALYDMVYNSGSLSNSGTCTIHFPSNLQSAVSQLDDYPTFGGDSGVIVLAFDLPATS